MKNISKLIPIAAVMALLLIGFSAPVSAGRGAGTGQPGWRPWHAGNLSDEDQKTLDKERQAFFDETQDLRQDMYQKRLELQSELAKKNPDAQKAAALQKDIAKFTVEFDQKRIDFILKMKKINPDIGRMGGWETMDDDDDADCPYGGGHHGRHVGRWLGYGMGPGMRGPGYGMGPGMMGDDDRDWNCPYGGRSRGPGRGYGMMGGGSGMGPGMMGPGYGMGSGFGRGTGSMGRAPAQGGTGTGAGRLETPIKEEGARTAVENYLQATRNPNLKLGKITEQGDAFEAEIVTKDGSLVDKLLIDKSTGWMHPAN
jgi:Spy/CpxP family protein refolding chaperone